MVGDSLIYSHVCLKNMVLCDTWNSSGNEVDISITDMFSSDEDMQFSPLPSKVRSR